MRFLAGMQKVYTLDGAPISSVCKCYLMGDVAWLLCVPSGGLYLKYSICNLHLKVALRNTLPCSTEKYVLF